MASPFARFRKHQKQYLAVFGVVIIIAFVVGSAGTTYLTCGQANPGEETAVEVDGDALSLIDVEALKESKRAANRFLYQFTGRSADGGDPDSLPTQRDVIDGYIIADKARQLGFVVTDESVSDFIHSLPLPPSSEQMQAFLRSYGYSERLLFDALQNELLVNSLFRTMFSGGISDTISPLQRWEYHQQMHRRTKVQAYPVEVKDFLAQVEQRMTSDPPSESELEELFEKYKNFVAEPESPDFGFKFPHKAAFEYVLANYNALFELESERVTAEEIERRYNDDIKENPTAYRYTESLNLPSFEGAPEAEPLDAPEEEAASTEPATTGTAEPETTPAPPANEPSEEGANEAEGEATPEEEPAAPGGDAPDGDIPAGDAPDGAALSGRGEPSFPVALQNEEQPANEPPAESEDPAADPAADPNAAAEANESTPPSGAEPPGGAASAAGTEPPGGAATTPDGTAVSPLDARKTWEQLQAELRIPDDINGGEKPKHDPLWKVEDSIRRKIAGERAEKDVEELFAPLQLAMDRYYNRLKSWQAQQKGERPAPPDLKALAEKSLQDFAAKKGLDLAALQAKDVLSVEPPTPQLTSDELAKQFDIGKTNVEAGEISARFGDFNYGRQEPDGSRSGGRVEYKPAVAKDADNRFLFWKIEESPERVPESLDDEREIHGGKESVRDMVLAAWKTLKARELAKQRAEEIAAEVQGSGKLLKDIETYAKNVIEPEPFAWKGGIGFDRETFSAAFGYDTNTVDGLKGAGTEILKTTYGLDADKHELGVAMNFPQDTAYVLQAVERDYVTRDQNSGLERPQEKIIYERAFLTTPLRLYGQLPSQTTSAMVRQWIDELRDEYDVNILIDDPRDAGR